MWALGRVFPEAWFTALHSKRPVGGGRQSLGLEANTGRATKLGGDPLGTVETQEALLALLRLRSCASRYWVVWE